ncbi:MAG: hypothetical protein KAH54_00190 [Candidatus Sabulitectum sp.]|nr:hypothetical protein [Candidatus Sabulitectum sp.]
MREEALRRIQALPDDLPERWREVLESALLNSEFSTEAELFIQSALAVHTEYPRGLEPAEAILAGDAFIPMAIESMLDNNQSTAEIEEFLARVACLFDK